MTLKDILKVISVYVVTSMSNISETVQDTSTVNEKNHTRAFKWYVHCRWPGRYFKVIRLFHIKFLVNSELCDKRYYRVLIGNHALAFDWCHFWWPWRTFEGHFSLLSFPRQISQKLAGFRAARSLSNSWASCCIVPPLIHTVCKRAVLRALLHTNVSGNRNVGGFGKIRCALLRVLLTHSLLITTPIAVIPPGTKRSAQQCYFREPERQRERNWLPELELENNFASENWIGTKIILTK